MPSFTLAGHQSLAQYNTFRVPARARWLAELGNPDALPALLDRAELRDMPLLVLGEGSNVLFTRDFDGVVLRLGAQCMRIVHDDGACVRVRAEAGANWDRFVRWTLAEGLCGLENLALIPGTVGAAPIQNIGAYGMELDQHIEVVEAFDREQGNMRRLTPDECGFSYRNSRFKQSPARWIVTAIECALHRTAALRLDYAGVRDELAAMNVAAPNADDVAAAVTRLRRRKLPDPAVIGNAGSFFKNPVVTDAQAETLHAAHPGLPVFKAAGGRKLSAAWLIEQCGWKGYREGDAGVSEKHALVLVNHGAASGAQIYALAQRIVDSVREKFGVVLEPEPRIL